ncbi:hypothetical protein NC653_033979 [Populus alba x Populus x berolinensis]|uniref:Uncharacterized protein n=2 Tax=Populus TaxID=3689 RepID=A0A4U5NQB7_POPAL|nr:hypothetical protein NC653_033979 [Populus alba x Populus x berolinensis]TKR85164.1 hypothetical protein D5086_0000250170 [Populus alba]
MFLFISYARKIFVCVGRIRILKDDSAVANSTPIRMSSVGGDVRDVIIGTSLKLCLFGCFYVLLLQFLVLGFGWVALIKEAVNGKDVDWSVICLLVVQGLAWSSFLTGGSKHLSSHVAANFTTTPTLAFLCFVAIRGVTSIQVYRNSERQEPLLLEEEAGCLKVTLYFEAGLFSLATFS